MGSLREWADALGNAVVWGVLMFFMFRRTDARYKGFVEIMQLAIASILFGILVTFGWHRAFQWPIVLITLMCVLFAILAGFFRFRESHSSTPR